MTLQRECSVVNLRHIFRGPFYKNTPRKLLLIVIPKQPTSRLIENESNLLHPSQCFSSFYREILIQPEQPKADIKN